MPGNLRLVRWIATRNIPALSGPRAPDILRAEVRASAENRPGVYRMVGPGEKLLYVGKSIRLRSRLLSYFRAERPEKAAEIVSHTHRIEWEYVPSEFAALLAEMRAIQAYRPPYNVEHKRDRAFCFIKLTREEAPRLLVATEMKDDGARYFGPFRGRDRIRETVRMVADLLELRDCTAATPVRFADQLDLFGVREETPLCLRADVGKCLAPCAARCSRADYLDQVAVARRFLDGDAEVPIAILRARMELAAERMQFEFAAQVRDRAGRLAIARDELLAARGAIDGLSFAYHVPGHDGADRVYVIRRGAVRAEFPAPATPDERTALDRRVCGILSRSDAWTASGRTALVAEVLLVARWFRLRPHELDATWRPAREETDYSSIRRMSSSAARSSSSMMEGRRPKRGAPAPPGLT
jgi:excinuclease ABC subunit C